MTYGLTPAGFVAPTVQEIVDAITADLLANLSANLDTSPDQPIGQLVGIFAEKIVEVWETVATIYNQSDPDAAEGYLLDALCALTGTRRRSATYSTVTCTLNLAGGTTVPAGAVVAVAGQPANTWVLEANAVNAGGTTADVSAVFRASYTGPTVANATTVTVIQTPVSGWNSVINPMDASVGIVEDTDATLRVRRQAELAAPGSGTIDAIRADLLQVAGVLQVFVLENNKDTYDTSTSLPAHSFAAIIWDGVSANAANNDVAQVIWNDKPTGVQSIGSISGVAVDSAGNNQTVPFFRAVQKPVYLRVRVQGDHVLSTPELQAVADTLAAYGRTNFNMGQLIYLTRLESIVLSVPHILDVTLTAGFAPSPGGTANLSFSQYEMPTLDSSAIDIDNA